MEYQKSPKSNNGIGTVIQICGALVIFFGIIVSLAAATPQSSSRSWYGDDEFNLGIALGGSVISVAAGMGLLAVAEVLNLLQTSCDLEYTILLHLRSDEEAGSGTGASPAPAGSGTGSVPPISAGPEPSVKGMFYGTSGAFIQYCPNCGAKQSGPASTCWHCGGALNER